MIGTRSTISKYKRYSFCRKLWGYVQFHEEVEYTQYESRDQEQITAQRWSTVFTLPFLRTFLEWQLLRSYGQVSRSLRCYPRMANPRLYNRSFWGGPDIDPLQDALTRREIPPFAVDDNGWTLLHYAAMFGNPDLCSMLIQLGVNPDQRNIHGYSPFTYSVHQTSDRTPETARVLLNHQSDLEAADFQGYYESYIGPPEGVELVFSYDMDLSKMSGHQNFQITPLHLALLRLGFYPEYSKTGGVSPEIWVYVVRKLLRGTVDLHAFCYNTSHLFRDRNGSELLTPLQCLLLGSDHPFDGEHAAKGWLALLHEAGYDQVAYLTQEMHAQGEYEIDLTEDTQDELTDLHTWFQIRAGTRSFYGPRSQPATIMFIHLDTPRVWWDWFIKPECRAYHVLHEFRNFNIHHETPCRHFTYQDRMWIEYVKWRHSWPFCYPDWSEESRPPSYLQAEEISAWEQRCKKARIQHARRAERTTEKLTRSQRRRARHLPGRWIE